MIKINIMNHKFYIQTIALFCIINVPSFSLADISPRTMARAAHAVEKSLVTVEYSLDPKTNKLPLNRVYISKKSNNSSLIIETQGFVISKNRVVTVDLGIPSSLIKRIRIKHRNSYLKVEIEAISLNKPALFLKILSTGHNLKSLNFVEKKASSVFFVYKKIVRNEWKLRASPINQATIKIGKEDLIELPARSCLLMNQEGHPVSVKLNGVMPLTNPSTIAPHKWPIIKPSQVKATLNKLKTGIERSLRRITLQFKNNDKAANGKFIRADYTGILIADDIILIAANLNKTQLNSLAGIEANLISKTSQKNKKIKATFKYYLKNIGCILAKLDKPAKTIIRFAKEPLEKTKDKSLFLAMAKINKDNITISMQRTRIHETSSTQNKSILAKLSYGNHGMLFDEYGKLLAIPIQSMAKPNNLSVPLIASRDIKLALEDLDNYEALSIAKPKPESRPVQVQPKETIENKDQMAWMGVHLQKLTPMLAQVHKVSGKTDNGKFGAIVSYVYPNSPASKAKITTGVILTRLHLPGSPTPSKVQIQSIKKNEFGLEFPALWERYNDIPENAFKLIPTPWSSLEDSVTQALSQTIIGSSYTAEFLINGKDVKINLVTEKCPEHFENTKPVEDLLTGITTKNLTLETRRHYGIKPNSPGIIISHVIAKSPASKAGIKPYEIVTHINDKAILTSENFLKIITKLSETSSKIRLNVLRNGRNRIASINLKN